MVSLGCSWLASVLPHACLYDIRTAVAGVRCRAAADTPVPSKPTLQGLRAFTKKWIRKNLKKIPADADTSVETWLEHTNYPLWRKDELRKKWEQVDDLFDPSKDYFGVKAFVKDETYTDFKHARGIYSRTDEFKCAVGPIFKLIEEEVYKNHHFIKHVPVNERPKYIQQLLERVGATYYGTDYTSFEALFRPEIMRAVEFQLYDYMTEDLPEHDWFMGICNKVLAGINHISFKYFDVDIPGTRMSGEMCTSLGNGFSNLMFMLYMCESLGSTCEGVVEGDDGLFSIVGPLPTAADFQNMGLIIKIEQTRNLSEASFCGLVFDSEDLINVTNPLEVLSTTGWTSRQYAKASQSRLKLLLRCKALSLIHQYSGCPIIAAYGRYILRVTKSWDVKKYVVYNKARMNMWEWSQLRDAHREFQANKASLLSREPGLNTRFLVEKLYNITVEQQFRTEKYLDSLNTLCPLEMPWLDGDVPEPWQRYAMTYVHTADPRSPDLNSPYHLYHQYEGFKPEFVC